MPTTTPVTGRFLYAAEAVPKGFRNPRRVLFHAPTHFELKTAAAADVEFDAVVIKPADSDVPVSYAMHEGQLYLPANRDREKRITIELYGKLLTAWPRLKPDAAKRHSGNPAVFVEPISHSYGPDDVHHWPDIRDPDERGKDYTLIDEEGYRGKVLQSDRTEAHRRYQEAAANVLLVGGDVYFKAIEPMWVAVPLGIDLVAGEPGFNHHDCYKPNDGGSGHYIREMEHTFSLHRRSDAEAWFAGRFSENPCRVRGEIVKATDTFDIPPALSRPLQGCLNSILTSIESNKEYLGAGSYAAWGRLRAAARSITPYDLGELNRDPAPLIADIVSIMGDLAKRYLPKTADRSRDEVKNDSSLLRERVRFENGLKPVLTEEDDLMIAAANGMKTS